MGTDSFPSFDLRQAETTAVVQDGDTLAIGGMIAENKTSDKTGVPYLMDIPVLGRFFRNTTDNTRRTELIMLITPHVIRNRSEGTAVTEELKSKLSILRNDLERMRLDRERDLEKMKRDWQEQQKQQTPVPPAPAEEAPSPAHRRVAARPAQQAPVTTLRNISVVPPEVPLTAPSPEPQSSIGNPASVLVSRVLPPQTVPIQDKVAEPARRKEIPTALSVVVSKEPPRVSACYEPSARTFSAGSALDGSGCLTKPNPRCRGDCR